LYFVVVENMVELETFSTSRSEFIAELKYEEITSLDRIEVVCKTSCMFAAAGKLECGPPHNSASASSETVAVYTSV